MYVSKKLQDPKQFNSILNYSDPEAAEIKLL
jgi:hypothetical protein